MRAKALPLVLGLMLVGCVPAWAQAPDTVLLEELTWTEVRDLLKAGKTTIMVPLGGTEQNGPHMALGKHNVRVKALAEDIARGLGNALVAPVIAYVPEGGINPPTGHMRFPGTITSRRTRSRRCSSRRRAASGCTASGTSCSSATTARPRRGSEAVAARLNREWADRRCASTRSRSTTGRRRSSSRGCSRRGAIRDAEIGKHAGLADTSLMLAIDPRLVRTDRLQPAASPAPDGVDGDPRRATAELGRLGVDAHREPDGGRDQEGHRPSLRRGEHAEEIP